MVMFGSHWSRSAKLFKSKLELKQIIFNFKTIIQNILKVLINELVQKNKLKLKHNITTFFIS